MIQVPGQVPWHAFWSLALIQSMNSLNEKGVQFVLIALGIWMGQELQYPLSILIVLPFVLFSPLAGWLADHFCKTRLLQHMVLLQVVVLAGMAAGLFCHNLWVAIGFFSLFCLQAMFFSPAKKGLVKDIVGTAHIGFASGILEITSLLALLAGQIGALYIVYQLLRHWGPSSGWEAAAWPCAACGLAAIIVYLLSFTIPCYPPQSKRSFRLNLFWEHFTQLRMLWHNKTLRHSEIGVGYFWFIAGTMMLIVLQMAAEANPAAPTAAGDFMRVLGQQKDSALLMVWLSGGSITGGIVASIICARRIHTWLAPIGGIGMTLGCLALAWSNYGSPLFFASLAFTGFVASGYLVPLNALLQDCADNDKRGDVIAAGNLVDCFLGMLAVGFQGAMNALGFSPSVQCYLLAVSSLLVALFMIRHTGTMRRA